MPGIIKIAFDDVPPTDREGFTGGKVVLCGFGTMFTKIKEYVILILAKGNIL